VAETTSTSPPGAARAETDTAAAGGQPGWVWVQDDTTGHRFDVHTSRLPVPGLTPVPGVAVNTQPLARPAKARSEWETDPAEPPMPATGKNVREAR
jgi:hypothetical protein